MLADVTSREKAIGKPVLPVFVVYNLPNRDCSAKSSNGELSLEAGGEQRYRTELIDPTAARLDESCISKDSAANAPEAGHWFDTYVLDLVKNANPPL